VAAPGCSATIALVTESSVQKLQGLYSSERAKAFIDAVVAIAMTLLILPLMESVSDVAGAEHGAAHWYAEHGMQLVSFVISFAVIASFWVNHHRMFAGVQRVSSGLLWVCIAWLLSIVWMPVATAMTGLMSSDDPIVVIGYVGAMILTSLLMLAQRLVLAARPQLHDIPRDDLRRGMAVDITMAVLFALALVVAVTVTEIGYFALFLLMLTGLVARRVVAPVLGVRRRVG